MGLSDAIARTAARHAHALVVELPGSWQTRVRAERAVLARGWRLAVSPADADVLVVCGESSPRLADALDLVWNQMPGPRVRVDVTDRDDVEARLDETHSALLDTHRHRRDAQHRPAAADVLADQHEDGEMDHGDMDHGDMDMSPGGIPLAEGGEDRDGLEMDVLTVRLGPVLPYWPAGLVLRCSLQGDVIVEAEAELLDGPAPDPDPGPSAARGVDNIASLLALAGWEDAATEARAVRDAVLDHPEDETTRARLEHLTRKLRRSRVLRWSLRGLRPVSRDAAHEHALPEEAIGDSYDRLDRMLDRASAGTAGPTFSAGQLSHLVAGLDLATARLVVASLDIRALNADRAGHEVSHG